MNILVTGIGGPAGQNVARLLQERQHQVYGVDMQQTTFQGAGFQKVMAAHHPDYLEQLQILKQAWHIDLIIPTVSEELPLMASQQGLPVVIGHEAAVKTANDKYLSYVQLAQAGVAVPYTVLPSQLTLGTIAMLGLPCLSKPRVSRGGRGVLLHEDYATLANLDDSHIVQGFAEGTEYTVNLFVGEDAKVVVLEKLELKEGKVGNAVRVERVSAPDVAQTALKAARSLGLTGPMDMDIRRDALGRPLVLEINARFGANIAHASEILDATLECVERKLWIFSPSSSMFQEA